MIKVERFMNIHTMQVWLTQLQGLVEVPVHKLIKYSGNSSSGMNTLGNCWQGQESRER